MKTADVKRTMTTVAALWVATMVLCQQPFSLDTTFRTVITEKNVNSIAVLQNGDILLSGRIRFPGDLSDRAVVKLDVNGSQVTTFPNTHGGGRLTPWDGKFYVSSGAVTRLLSDGSEDPSFIDMNTGPYYSYFEVGSYHVYPDGRILMSGTHTLSDSIRGFVGNYDLIWFSDQGYLDTTRIHRRGNGRVHQFKELPDGGFICTSTCTQFEGIDVDWVFKTDSLGIPDSTYRTGVYIGSALDFLPLPNGRVYAAGNFETTQAPGDTLRLVRFMPDGTLDASFSIPQFDDGPYDWPYGAGVSFLYPLSGGRVIATGQFQYVNGELRKGICMLDSSGQLLPAFEACGVDSISLFQLPFATIASLTTDSAGMIYVCGAYVGYTDGVVSDTTQRFVSRLYGEDFGLGTNTAQMIRSKLSVYPNPASVRAELQWSLPLPRTHGHAHLSVINSTGKLVHTEVLDLSTSTQTLDVQHLAPGLYYLHVVQGTTWVSGCKLVVE